MNRWYGLMLYNNTFNVEFPASLPRSLRYQIQPDVPEAMKPVGMDWAILNVKYTEPNSIKITLGNGTSIRPFSLAENKDLNDYTWSCGANIYDADNRTISFVVTKGDDCIVTATVINSVKIAMRLETTVEDFYKNNMAASFVDKMAAFLGIPMDRIRIVNVRTGSAIVDFTVDSADDSEDANEESALAELTAVAEKIEKAAASNTLDVGAPVLGVTKVLMVSPPIVLKANKPENPVVDPVVDPVVTPIVKEEPIQDATTKD